MKARARAYEAWLAAAAWAGVRLAWPPPGHNTHTLMYPLVEAAGGYNTLEPFHSLYLPIVTAARKIWELAGGGPPALPAIQAVSLAAGAANIVLLHRAVKRATGSDDAALGAALILCVSANLWSWGLMTTSYTLSTLCVLALADRLLMNERLTERDAAWAGLWAGLAAGLDTASGVAALAAAYELHRRRAPSARPARYWGAFLCAAAGPVLLGLACLVARLAAAGWPFEPTWAGFRASLPNDIIPLWSSRDLPGQIRGWAASTAPLDLPLWAALAVLLWSRRAAKGWAESALWRLGFGLWALVSLFFFVNDPHNRFLYASVTLLPALFALAALKTKRPLAYCAAAAGLLAAWHWRVPPQYAVDGNLGFVEARFLGERLGREDLLIALSDPDWVFAYAYGGRSRVLKLARPGDDEVLFGAEAVAPGADLEAKLDAALCGGRKAAFAADALFRSSRRSPATLDAEAREVYARLSKRYTVEAPWVSPRGQHYIPLTARRCPRAI